MARRKKVYTKEYTPDPRYGNILVTKLINHVMLSGKKSVAQRVVYDAFDIVKEKTKKDPIEVFDLAIKNVAPALEVKGRRIGGANYQIPYEVKGERRNTLAFRWIIEAARNKKGQPMAQKLSGEILEAAKRQGVAIKKKEDVQKMAESNKAFAHFAY